MDLAIILFVTNALMAGLIYLTFEMIWQSSGSPPLSHWGEDKGEGNCLRRSI
jgi:hypothetical protein